MNNNSNFTNRARTLEIQFKNSRFCCIARNNTYIINPKWKIKHKKQRNNQENLEQSRIKKVQPQREERENKGNKSDEREIESSDNRLMMYQVQRPVFSEF